MSRRVRAGARRRGDAHADRGTGRGRQDRAGACGTRGGRACRPDGARGDRLRARAAVRVRRGAPAARADPGRSLRSVRRRRRPRGAPVRARAARGAATTRASRRSTACTGWSSTSPTRRRCSCSVDDCHWVDQDSLRFLAFLAQRIEGLPVAMLLAGRPPVDEPGSVWVQVASRAAAVALYPRPLSESAAVALARERLGADAAEEFCRACHTATGGNPLFLRELLNAVDAARIAPSAAAASEVQDVGPAAVRRFVLHRLATLGPDANELARAVAVLGDDTELALAAGVTGLGEEVAAAAADDLVRADIFVQDERLGFVHPSCAPRSTRISRRASARTRHAAAAEALADGGRVARAGHRAPAVDLRDRGPAQDRDAQVGRRRRRARRRSGRGRRAPRPGARGIAHGAGAGGDPGRARPLRRRRDAVRRGRGAPAGGAGHGGEPGDAGRRGGHARALRGRLGRRSRGGGRGRGAGRARRRAPPARSGARARARDGAADGDDGRGATALAPRRASAALHRGGARSSPLRGGGADPRRLGARRGGRVGRGSRWRRRRPRWPPGSRRPRRRAPP